MAICDLARSLPSGSSWFALLLTTCIAIGACADNVPVTCGSTLKLVHVATKVRLHSHQVGYSRGSQQQSVTGFPTGDDAQSYWVVHGPLGEQCTPGATFKKGSKIRLQHTGTRKWMHSHDYQSPLTNNQEVSAFGDDENSDSGDVWIVEWDTKGKVWKQDTKVRLKHVETSAFLTSYDHAKFGHPIGGQQEVCGHKTKSKNADWQTAEGVYLPVLSDGTEENAPNDEL